MKTGIIGLPQVGKTSLFGILTKAHLSEQAYSNPASAYRRGQSSRTSASTSWPPLYDPRNSPTPPSNTWTWAPLARKR